MSDPEAAECACLEIGCRQASDGLREDSKHCHILLTGDCSLTPTEGHVRCVQYTYWPTWADIIEIIWRSQTDA